MKLSDLFTRKRKEPEVSSVNFRSGRYTVTFFDDEMRPIKRFPGCTNVKTAYYEITFSDEVGLQHKWCGSAYSCVEEV